MLYRTSGVFGRHKLPVRSEEGTGGMRSVGESDFLDLVGLMIGCRLHPDAELADSACEMGMSAISIAPPLA